MCPQPSLDGKIGQRVLRVVNDEIGTLEKLHVAPIFVVDGLGADGRVERVQGVRLVIAGVDHGGAIDFEAKTECERGVVQILRGHANRTDLEDALRQVGVAEFGHQGIQVDGRVLVGHLPGEGGLQPPITPARGVHRPSRALDEERIEEREPLDVIPVGVADQQVPDDGFAALRQRFAEPVRARPAVQYDERSIRSAQFDTRGIAPVANRRGSGRCNRSSRAPELDLHPG